MDTESHGNSGLVVAVVDAIGDDARLRLGDLLDRHRHAQNRGLEGDRQVASIITAKPLSCSSSPYASTVASSTSAFSSSPLSSGTRKAYAASVTRAGHLMVGRFVEGILGNFPEAASFIMMCAGKERKAIHDWIAGTVVLHDPKKILAR